MTTIQYEKEPCSRCGGSGHYSYCQRFGTTCFKCNGKGKQLTRRGKAALKAITKFQDDNYSKPVEEIEAGCQILDRDGYRTVTEVRLFQGSRSKVDGGEWQQNHSIVTPKVTIGCAPGTLYRVRPTKEQFNEELVPFARRYSGAIITT